MKLSYIGLGSGMAKQENGFSGEGDWTLYKMFYEENGRYSEFYLNFNSKTNEAEIKSKDNNYAEALLAGLKDEVLGVEPADEKYANLKKEDDIFFPKA